MNRLADALVGATAANIAHRVVNVFVGGLGFALEQSRCRHDLTRLAVTALRHIHFGPGLLDGVAGRG